MNSVAAGDSFEEVSLISVITEISDESDFESRGLNGLSCRVSAGSGHKRSSPAGGGGPPVGWWRGTGGLRGGRSEEHTSELQSLMRISYAVFCLKKKTK